MLRKLYISLIITACALTVQAQATSPPIQACVGGRSVFAVSGEPGAAFRFEVTGGKVIDSTRLDSIVVQWDMEQGLHKIRVKDARQSNWIDTVKALFGLDDIGIDPECLSPWTYIEVDLRGRPFRFPEPNVTLNAGEVIPINQRLYRNIRWYDEGGTPRPNVATEGFTIPGNYQIWLQDMHGCTHTDTITVSLR